MPERDPNWRGTAPGAARPEHLDPVIWHLVARLPAPGTVWSRAERTAWLAALDGVLDVVYARAGAEPPPAPPDW